jgi:outer membrane protein assembly factor BamE (lipoprotein component of BamABCDE complex)
MLTSYLAIAVAAVALLAAACSIYYTRKATQDREKAARLLREATARQQGRRLP